MTKRVRRGFTLVEMLVVISIILLLCALVVVLIKGSIDRSKNAKSKSLIEMLDKACSDYRVDFGVFPPGPGSQNLHLALGSPRTMVTAHNVSGPNISTLKPPYIEFRRDMLPLTATSTSPTPPQVIVDAWERDVQYINPGLNNTKAVDIWSIGKDAADPLDDIANWIRDY